MKYSFFAYDCFEPGKNFDFTRQHYQDLMDFCFFYGSIFSLVIPYNTVCSIEDLSAWSIPKPDFPSQNETSPEERMYYRCCEASKDFLLHFAQSIFDFQYPNPADIAFYRQDGTILLNSCMECGECSIFPASSEDIQLLLSHGHWLEMQGGDPFHIGVPRVLAKSHQPTPHFLWNVLQEPIYIRLREIQNSPEVRSGIEDITELISYVETVRSSVLKDLAASIGKYTPPWYSAFELFVLGACDAYTCDQIPDAMEKAGFSGKESVDIYFALLDQFVLLYENTVKDAITPS